MADNLSVPGLGTVATDDISGVHNQRVKMRFGADGSATDVSPTDPLPVREQYRALTTVASSCTSSGDNTIIAQPGTNKRLVVRNCLVQNASATTTDVIIKSGSTAKRYFTLAQNDAFAANYPDGGEFRLGTNEALVINLSGANKHWYYFDYWTEDV